MSYSKISLTIDFTQCSLLKEAVHGRADIFEQNIPFLCVSHNLSILQLLEQKSRLI